MSFRVVMSRLLSLLTKARSEEELRDEIAFHLESLEKDYLRAGLSPQEARVAARRAFGRIESMKEAHRDVRSFRGLESLVQDWRLAGRAVRRSGWHAVLVIITFALGIAGSTAVFSVYDRMFLRPLPFDEAASLVNLDERAEEMPSIRLAYANFLAWRETARTFESMAAWAETGYNLSFDNDSERIQGARVTHDLDDVLRITPLLGRAIAAEENVLNGPKSAVLGHALWQRRFGGRSDVLGKRIMLNGETFTVVGVLPERAVYPDKAEIWTPLQENPQYGVGWFLLGVGRLAQGETIRSAQAELDHIQARLATSQGHDFATFPVLTGLREHHLGGLRNGATLILVAVGVVLLIACGNAASLMLVGAARRRRELATRLALGASRGRIVRQLTTESVISSLLGGLLGSVAGWVTLRGMVMLRPGELPGWLQFDLDERFLVFAIGVTLLAGLGVGFVSAIRSTRATGNSTLSRAATKHSSDRNDRRSLDVLVVGQAALALAVLMVAGLLFQALARVHDVKPGFEAEHALAFTLSLPRSHYAEGNRRADFFRTLLEEAAGLPGMLAVGAASLPPLEGYSGTTFVPEGARPDRASEQIEPPVLLQSTVGDYFGAMGIAVLDGRGFEDRDRGPKAAQVVIVNESFARHYFGDQRPVGRRIRYGNLPDSWMMIVGVSGDVRHRGLERAAPLAAYIPLAQRADAYSTMTVVARGAGAATDLAPPLLQIVRERDARIPAYGLATLEERLARGTLVRRAYTWMASAFALLALVLTVAGFHGVTTYLVRQRWREIGIRLALGEPRKAIQWRIVGRAMTLAGLGSMIGLIAGGYAALLMESLLFGLPAWAPRPILIACVLTFTVVLLAIWVPAMRASWLNPRELIGSE